MFQVFYLYVAYVAMAIRMFQAYVSNVFRLMVQVFYLDVAKVDLDLTYVAMAIHACIQEHV
jgi:hypothetical protein